ncbi:MAG TPA: metal-binding protein [Legionella sp.]|nr:metal-binding protein [Legionella sp.]
MLNVQDLAKQNHQTKTITLLERLPGFISPPCHLTAQYTVEAKDDFYLIHLQVVGDLTVICQRCMLEFNLPYDNSTIIAVCRDEDRAEQLLEQYECIAASNWQVDLNDLVIDELHLYVDQFHSQIEDCDEEVTKILKKQIETY